MARNEKNKFVEEARFATKSCEFDRRESAKKKKTKENVEYDPQVA